MVLAIDVGTQSARALAFDLAGELVGKGQAPLDAYRSPKPGWHEIEAEAVWATLAYACRRLWDAAPGVRERLAGVALTTQRATVVPTDAQGAALAPAMTWLDQRRAAAAPRLPLRWRIAADRRRRRGRDAALHREAEAAWLAENRPDVTARLSKFLLLSGYLHWRLTGRCVDSVGAQVGYLPFDYKRQRWAASGDWKWKALTLKPEQMPELAPVGARLGAMTDEAAAATGVPAGLPVSPRRRTRRAGCSAPAAPGSSVGGLSYGTTATIAVRSPRYIEAIRLAPSYPSATPGFFDSEVQIFRGYWLVSWFRDEFAAIEKAEAERHGVAAESLFEEFLAATPPGALGLTLQPYWTPGVRFPPARRRARSSASATPTPAPISIAPSSRGSSMRCATARSASCAKPARRSPSCASPAAARSRTARYADHRRHLQSAGQAAAHLRDRWPRRGDRAAVGLGLHRDFDAATAAMTRVARVFEPDRRRRRAL